MGIDYAYFAAATDAGASETAGRPNGPGSQEVLVESVPGKRKTWFRHAKVPEPDWKLDPSLPLFDTVMVRGIEPTVQMGTLEALLTGRAYDNVAQDPRSGQVLADKDDGGCLVVTLSDSLLSALAASDAATFGQVASSWLETDEFQTPFGDPWEPTDVVAFLVEVGALAGRAEAAGHHLYCWMSL